MLAKTTPLPRVTTPDVAATPAFARVEVHRDAGPILDAWAELEEASPCSIYQTRAWLLPWIETLGRKAGLKPLFVLARDRNDKCVALLCLGIIRRGPMRIATWLGGSDSNFNMPLVRPEAAWTQSCVIRLLRTAARACTTQRPHLFALKNQPLTWNGRANPFAVLTHRPSPSAAYGTALPGEAEALFAQKLSKDTRKKLRKKEAKLAALGPLTHIVVATAEEQRRVIDAFIAQKVSRFREKRIVSEFDTPEMRAFIEAASRPSGCGIELHALRAGERIVAVYGGAAHDGQWSGMFNAFDGDEEIAKSSPGDLLLMRIVAKACKDGLGRLDLGVGEARYKASLCDEKTPLFDAFIPVGPVGILAARWLSAQQLAKGAIKKNPRLMAWAQRVRAIAS